MLEFKRETDGFHYVCDDTIAANATEYLKMPRVSPNKRGINDIGWQSDGNVKLYGTLSRKPETALWQEIEPYDEVNKVVSYLKIVNNGGECRIIIRAIFN